MSGPAITVEVVYALKERQALERVTLPAGSSVEDAIRSSRLLERFPEIDLSGTRVGIFGRLESFGSVLADGDRVEIYRPLLADPRESRRRRAARQSGR